MRLQALPRRAKTLRGRYRVWVWWQGPPVARLVDGEVEVTEGQACLVPVTWARRFGWAWQRLPVTATAAMTDEDFERFLDETWGGNRDGS